MTMNTTRKIWIITDTHFNHRKLIDIGERPADFEARILTKLTMLVKDDDIVIHLGDFCIGNEELWHREFMNACGKARKYLVRGNHDHKSQTWYYDHGWDLVSAAMILKVNGKSVLLSHRPMPKFSAQMKDGIQQITQFNLHGHTHGNAHRDEEHAPFYDPAYHIEVAMEHKPLYEPRLLKNLIK